MKRDRESFMFNQSIFKSKIKQSEAEAKSKDAQRIKLNCWDYAQLPIEKRKRPDYLKPIFTLEKIKELHKEIQAIVPSATLEETLKYIPVEGPTERYDIIPSDKKGNFQKAITTCESRTDPTSVESRKNDICYLIELPDKNYCIIYRTNDDGTFSGEFLNYQIWNSDFTELLTRSQASTKIVNFVYIDSANVYYEAGAIHIRPIIIDPMSVYSRIPDKNEWIISDPVYHAIPKNRVG